MNVLIISHEKNLNGASKSMLNLIDQLADRVNFYVCLPFKEGPVYEELINRKIYFIYCPMKRWIKTKKGSIEWILKKIKWYCFDKLYNYISIYCIIKKLKHINIDIIHTNVSVINIGAILSKKLKKPHVWYFREFGQEDFSMYPACSWNYFYKTINNNSNAVIFVSKALKNKYTQYINKVKQYVIYNGVGKENLLTYHVYSELNEKCIFLITGALQKGKGQDIAILAVDELVKRGIFNFKLLIAGRNDNSWLTSMPCYQPEYIEFLGQVENIVLVREKADVELVCSRKEAFGRVTVEAMLAGMPVIGSNSGGTPELIKDTITGFLFEPGNFIELADKMQYFIENRGEVKKMGLKAREYAKTHFLINQCAEKVYNIYKSLLVSYNEHDKS